MKTSMNSWLARGYGRSLFLPTHIARREIRQDRIRLKNLIPQAAARLRSEWRRSEAHDLLAPVASLIGDDTSWRHQEQALAAFVAPGSYKAHRLPIEIAEQVVQLCGSDGVAAGWSGNSRGTAESAAACECGRHSCVINHGKRDG